MRGVSRLVVLAAALGVVTRESQCMRNLAMNRRGVTATAAFCFLAQAFSSHTPSLGHFRRVLLVTPTCLRLERRVYNRD